MLVLIVSIIPEGPDLSAGRLDKAAHLCEYFLFAWLLVQAIRANRTPEPDCRLWAWMYATSYGLLMELIQAIIPWRSAEWGDVLADAAGAALGVWLGWRAPRVNKPVVQ
ncbi:MAG: VanZ family protein [Candidatus Omnitrophica bacterium]|nr:VanZ family protein [Candidatus Omnitrophota bacterium]